MIVLLLPGSRGNYIKYVSFPWLPVVAAHDRKGLAQELHSSGSYGLYKKLSLHPGFSYVHQILPFTSN